MRGKASAAFSAHAAVGITPAYAGKSRTVDVFADDVKDHPRLCGEKCPRIPPSVRSVGSPPPMRGKVPNVRYGLPRRRITPAYAGKSPFPAADTLSPPDHPRLCGEKPGRALTVSTMLGSPPPMRGKEIESPIYDGDGGITPAYAGKSLPQTAVITPDRDHPRLCGEKTN